MPLEISKRQNKRDCAEAGSFCIPGMKLKVPTKAEKKMTYAQTSRILNSDDLTAWQNSVGDVMDRLSVVAFWYDGGAFLQVIAMKSPVRIEAERTDRYSAKPNFGFPHREPPTALMRNADEGLLEKQSTRSASDLEILFCS